MTHPLTLSLPSGEDFLLLSSARGPAGVFRFQWTLAPGKTGPPPHLHPHESETFHVRSGTLRIWLDGAAHECGPGDVLTAPAGTMHRFLNPGTEPAVVDVSIDGALQEDNLVGLALVSEGGRPRLSQGLRQFVQQVHMGAIGAPGLAGLVMRLVARVLVALGVRGYAAAPGWDAQVRAEEPSAK